MKRRQFLSTSLTALGATVLPACSKELTTTTKAGPFFQTSLAQWSLNVMHKEKKLTNLDFPKFSKDTFGITAVEYVNRYFGDNVTNQTYLTDLKERTDGEGVRSLLIMCDRLGKLEAATEQERNQAVEAHKPWIEAAKFLGCHSIRVNLNDKGDAEEIAKQGIDGLRKLAEIGKQSDMNVVVENHGNHSSNGKWLAQVLKTVNMDNCGSLPDFGNFDEYDRYQGVRDLMPFAKGVSAKSNDFNEQGEEIHTDFYKIMQIVKDAGFKGHVGIEYSGKKISEIDGIKATQALLNKVAEKLS